MQVGVRPYSIYVYLEAIKRVQPREAQREAPATNTAAADSVPVVAYSLKGSIYSWLAGKV